MSRWQETAAAQAALVKPRTGIVVWDTGQPSAAALAPVALAGQNDWSAIPLEKTADSSQGDAVLSNGRIAAVLRKLERAVEVYALKPDGAVARLRLRLLSTSGAADRLERLSLVVKSYLAPFVSGAYYRQLDQETMERISYSYPCWSNRSGQGFLQPLEYNERRFQGPAVVYPIRRVETTPLETFAVEEVMRQTLGAGAYGHILDVEGQKQMYKGRPACPTFGRLHDIYKQNQQKEKRAEIEQGLDDVLTFVTFIRQRIIHNQKFAQKMRQYLAEQKQAHPHLADFFVEADKLVQEIPARVAAWETKIKTPEQVARLNADFRKHVLDYDGLEALNRLQEHSRAVIETSGSQDELIAECRGVGKTLRQWAGKQMILDPRVVPMALEIRARTQEAMRHPAFWEQGTG